MNMDQKPKPIRKNGEKNVFCPYYKNCLNHTAKLHWKNWDCSECPHKLTQQPIKTDQMTSGFSCCCELQLRIHVNNHENLI